MRQDAVSICGDGAAAVRRSSGGVGERWVVGDDGAGDCVLLDFLEIDAGWCKLERSRTLLIEIG
jgi:hypothetical protein